MTSTILVHMKNSYMSVQIKVVMQHVGRLDAPIEILFLLVN
jgi:hypothetical protein